MGPLAACGRRRADRDPGRDPRDGGPRPVGPGCGRPRGGGGDPDRRRPRRARAGAVGLHRLDAPAPGADRRRPRADAARTDPGALAGVGSLAIHGGWTIGARHGRSSLGLLHPDPDLQWPTCSPSRPPPNAPARRSCSTRGSRSRPSCGSATQSTRACAPPATACPTSGRRSARSTRRPATGPTYDQLRSALTDQAAAGGDARLLARVPGRRGDRAPGAHPGGRRQTRGGRMSACAGPSRRSARRSPCGRLPRARWCNYAPASVASPCAPRHWHHVSSYSDLENEVGPLGRSPAPPATCTSPSRRSCSRSRARPSCAGSRQAWALDARDRRRGARGRGPGDLRRPEGWSRERGRGPAPAHRHAAPAARSADAAGAGRSSADRAPGAGSPRAPAVVG